MRTYSSKKDRSLYRFVYVAHHVILFINWILSKEKKEEIRRTAKEIIKISGRMLRKPYIKVAESEQALERIGYLNDRCEELWNIQLPKKNTKKP